MEFIAIANGLKRMVNPTSTIANNADIKLIPEYLSILTEIEEMLIARVHVYRLAVGLG